MKASDTQIGGAHYKDMPIQQALYAFRNDLNPLASAIVKYASRAGRGVERAKGGRAGMESDVRKIIHYAELWLEYEGFNDAP
jgi:hypothetical protein